jgi:RecA-family ATPase
MDTEDPRLQAFEEYRAQRDRREGDMPRPRLVADHGEPVGMDERPLPPLEAYAEATERDADRPARNRPEAIPAPARSSRFYSLAELNEKAVPDREWLVPDLVPLRTVTLLGGDGGTGKSLCALQLAIGVATGCGWLGKPVRRGGVIFISAEDDDDELHRRVDDILQSVGLRYDDAASLTLRSLAGEDALLAVETKAALIQSTLFEELDARAADESPVLIVIDTLADVYPSNENDRVKVRQFISILRGLALKRRCAVMLLAHPSLTGLTSGSGTSGSTAWNNSVRSRLYLSRVVHDGFEQDPDKRVLATKKANYGRAGGEIALTYRDGIFVVDGTPAGLDRMATGAKAERVFMALLRIYTEQGRYVSASPSATHAPSQFAKHPKAEGITKRAFTAAMEALFDRSEIVIAEHGRGVNIRKHIAIAGSTDRAA